MNISKLGQDVILVHLVPFLEIENIRSMASTCKAMDSMLGDLRHKTSYVQNIGRYFRNYLVPATVRTIRHLILNGSEEEHNDIFRCRDLNNVARITIITPITDAQKFAFSRWARRLIDIREEGDYNGTDIPTTSSLSDMPSGTLSRTQRIRLDICVPSGFERLLSVAHSLCHIEFLPAFNSAGVDGIMEYSRLFETLLPLLGDRETLPSLKFVHILASTERVLARSWAAAHSHGGWKMLMRNPSRELIQDGAVAWGRYWPNQEWNFFITIEGFQYFVDDCMEWGIYPRITDFLEGRVHILLTGETVKNGLLIDTEVYGLAIRHNETTDLTNALRVVTKDTRVIDVSMQTYWGAVSEIRPDSGPYKKVEGFAINGPGLGHIQRRYIYTDNHSARLVHSLLLSQWSSLVNLSLPAMAFQKATEGKVLGSAACGYHIGEFDMSWLASIKSLKALTIKGWFSCDHCRLKPEVRFKYGMTFVPETVEFLKITGHMWCIGETPEWVKLFAGDLIQVLRKKREDINVDLDEWSVGNDQRTDCILFLDMR